MKLPRRLRALPVAALVAASVAALGSGGLSTSAAGTAARETGYRILLASDRDGKQRAYSVRPDSSRLTPLLPRGRDLVPVAASADGGTVAYRDSSYSIYVSRANGTRVRRVTREAFDVAVSRDGKLLAFRAGDNFSIFVVRADGRGRRRLTPGSEDFDPKWSPDGKAVVYQHDYGDEGHSVVVRPLRGERRVVARGEVPEWSPDGRWIAYSGRGKGLYVVKPNGKRRHRVARGRDEFGAFSWSPDGRRLAFAVSSGDVAVVGVDGRGLKRLALRGVSAAALAWSPDGQRLAIEGGDGQIRVVGRDGRGLRRLTARGGNHLLGWTRLAPVLPPARPIPPTERVVGVSTLASRVRISDLAADGPRVAFIAESTATDCHHVAVWTPARKSIRRVSFPAPCPEHRDGLSTLALAGSRIAWVSTPGHEAYVVSGTLEHPGREWLDVSGAASVGGPVGDGNVLALTVGRTCEADPSSPELACPPDREPGDVVAATLNRIGGPGPCRLPGAGRRSCTTIAKADGDLSLLAVDAGRIVVGTEDGVRLLTAGGRVLRDFPLFADAAALSGNRLALGGDGVVDVYDVRSGRHTASFSGLGRLQDLEGDLLVTASAKRVVVLKLGAGRKLAIPAASRAEIEPPGLFVAGARRITFTPMRELRRRLGG